MVHQADKGYVSEFHYGLAHKPTSIKEVMNLPEANAAVDKEWDWDIKQVKSKAEVLFTLHPVGVFASGSMRDLQRTSTKTKEESCSGRERQHDDRYNVVFTDQIAWRQQNSWTRFPDFQVRQEMPTTRWQRALQYLCRKLPGC